MQGKLLFCSKGSTLDMRDGTVSVFQIFEELKAAGFPLFVPAVSVVFFCTRLQDEPEEQSLEIRVELGDNTLFRGPITVVFVGGGLRTKVLADLQGLVVPGEGTMSISIRQEDRTLGLWPVQVSRIAGPELRLAPAQLAPAATGPPSAG
jgi:hypothetical protein